MNAELTLRPKAAVTEIKGEPVAAYLLFREGIVAHKTHCFQHTEEPTASLLIDVDRNNIPIGMGIS